MNRKHLDAIMEIEEQSFSIRWTRNMFLEELNNPLAHYFVVKHIFRIIGYAGMWFIHDEAHITNIAIHPFYQGKGYGEKILQFLIEYARSIRIQKMTLEVRMSNTKAISLYKKQGFIESGVRKAYYSDNKEDAIIMWRYSC
ncbi:MAG: ribosomal protein S18-alanine N-acetyltransferase [Eubacteriales bacterium]